MASQLDSILDSLRSGAHSLDEACRALSAASRANPDGSRMWPMLIESRVTQGVLSVAHGRALCDALEQFEPEKTMWLAPKSAAIEPPHGEVLHAPAGKLRTGARDLAIDTPEQLAAFLWDTPTQDCDAPHVTIPTLAPPPRAMPGAVSVLPPVELGAVIKDRYRLEAHLGYGGIGQVFSAVDLHAQREGKRDPRLTIKMIAVDLKREPQALMAMKIAVAKIKPLKHPNIVTTYGVEHDDARLFVTMEPLFGRWLGERIRAVRNVGVSQDVAWPIIEGIANGLRYAHENGVVHSDLSPYAVFLAEDGTPKIMGFGLIHALPTSNEAMDLLDTMTLRAYSEAYTVNVWATHATPQPVDDLYPLGVIAYELLTGKHPFQRCSLTMARQRKLIAPPIPGIKRRAAKLIQRCLSFDRKERPLDAARFLTRMYGPMWVRTLFGDRFGAFRNT